MNLVEKKQFTIKQFEFECHEVLDVTLGYETYGTLNEDKSNVILVGHYFSASSHAAGKYGGNDVVAGYWDALIGPDKAIDTNQYFVISIDNLANVQSKNQMVITTGPRSINPKTGKRYGMTFPVFTFKDVAKIQQAFLTQQLNINKLHAVVGASAGGFIALNFAVEFPQMVERVIGVITNPQNPIITSFSVLQHAMRAIEMDPKWQDGNYEDDDAPNDGLALAIQMMNAGAFTAELYENTYKRDSLEDAPYLDIKAKASYEVQLDSAARAGLPIIDASHWYYTCKATMLHDLARNHESLEKAYECIQAKVLMISCTDDLLQPTCFSEQMVKTLKQLGKDANLYKISSEKGHMAGVLDTHLFADQISMLLQTK